MVDTRPPGESVQDVGNEPRGLLRSTSVVGAMTMLSRISGLARDIGFSRWFGASPLMDAFFVAFKIPNLLRRFFAEGAFAAAFVRCSPSTGPLAAQRTPGNSRTG